MNNYIKYLIFSIFSIFLIAPAIQTFKIIPLQPLEGAYNLIKRPTWTKETWFSGEFQDQFGKSVEDHIGFRSWFTRVRNEIDYRIFNIVHTYNLVIGKEKVLFQDMYIQAFNGEDFVGEDIVKRKLDKFQFVQDELAKKGIFMMLLIAPGKASIYPEYIPDELMKKPKSKTNYDAYIEAIQYRSINHIDLRNYLTHVKDTARHALFPKCGTHWSGYTITVVADTLFKYIEQKTNIDLNIFQSRSGYETNSEFRFTDNDIGKAMNLIWDIKSWNVYYPTIEFDTISTKEKPDILAIGDSFTQSFWGFYPFFDHTFGSNSQYWYYNQIISWPDSLVYNYTPTSILDYKKEIEQRKIVLIVTTEQNLANFGFSFIDEAYSIYNPEKQYDKRIADFTRNAHNDSALRASIQIKAQNNYTTFDNMAFIDAKWVINEEEKKIDADLHQKYLDSIGGHTMK